MVTTIHPHMTDIYGEDDDSSNNVIIQDSVAIFEMPKC